MSLFSGLNCKMSILIGLLSIINLLAPKYSDAATFNFNCLAGAMSPQPARSAVEKSLARQQRKLDKVKQPVEVRFLDHNQSLLEAGSAADRNPRLIERLEKIGAGAPNVKNWAMQKPGLTVGEVIEKSFALRTRSASYLESLARTLPAQEPLRQILLDASIEFKPSVDELSSLQEKIQSGEASVVVEVTGPNAQLASDLDSYFAFTRGKKGELLVAAMLNHLQARSVRVLDLVPTATVQLEALGFTHQKVISMTQKEIDLVTTASDGTSAWVEVKNLGKSISLAKLKKGRGSQKSIYQQALDTLEIIKVLGLEHKVKVKQVFLNCIAKEAALALTGLGIEVLGCIQ